jgi:hypothetical protein
VNISQELIDFTLIEMPLVSVAKKPARFATEQT